MATLRLSTPLRPYAGGKSEVQLAGQTVAEAMDALVHQYPDLKPHLFNGEGALRSYVHLFINEEDIQQLNGLKTPLRESDRMMVIPSIAGGRG